MRRALLFALTTLSSAGCFSIEPREVAGDAYVPTDTADAAVAPDCANGGVCPEGFYCDTDRDGDPACVELPSACQSTTDCAPHGANVVCAQRTSSSTTAAACEPVPGGCTQGSDCASGHCTPAGYCGPRIAFTTAVTGACDDNADCGPSGSCINGVCGGCTGNSDCTGELECTFGRCSQVAECKRDDQCYGDNRCEIAVGAPAGSCARRTVTCTPDPSNDDITTAEALPLRWQTDLSICGDDLDWYQLTADTGDGLTVIVNWDSAAGTLDADFTDEGGSIIDAAAKLSVPGMIQLSLSAADRPLDIRMVVFSLDTSVSYTLDARAVPFACAGDALDLYGDAYPTGWVQLPENITTRLAACPGDVDTFTVPVGFDNRLEATAAFVSAGVIGAVELLRPDGTVVAMGGPNDGVATTSVTASAVETFTSTTWTIRVSTPATPSFGDAYELSLATELGTRRQACASIAAASSSQRVRLTDEDDLGGAKCDLWPDARRPDALWRIDPAAVGTVIRATVRPQTAGHTLAVGLLTECGDDATHVRCDASPDAGLGASLEHVATSTAPLYVMVTASSTAAEFDLEIDLDTSDNFTCRGRAAQQILQTTNGSQIDTFTVSTEAATNTVEVTDGNMCSAAVGSATGPDRFYKLDLAPSEAAVVTLEGPDGGYLWVATDCGAFTRTCTAAQAIDDRTPAQVILRPGTSENYFIAVDGQTRNDVGTYQLTINRNPPCITDADCNGQVCDEFECRSTPPNNTCPGTEVVLVNGSATIEGSTGAAEPTYTHVGCGGFGGGDRGASSNDVVYRVELPGGAPRLKAEITTATGWDPLLAIRKDMCTASTSEVACNDDYPDEPNATTRLPLIELTGVDAGTYYIIVDAWTVPELGPGGGSFTLQIDTL